jgi:hypothetical protein
MRESVLEGETENRWTQMITVTGAKNLAANSQLTPQKFVESMANGYQQRCPASFSIVGVPTGQISGFEAFSAIVSCGTSPLTGGRFEWGDTPKSTLLKTWLRPDVVG